MITTDILTVIATGITTYITTDISTDITADISSDITTAHQFELNTIEFQLVVQAIQI